MTFMQVVAPKGAVLLPVECNVKRSTLDLQDFSLRRAMQGGSSEKSCFGHCPVTVTIPRLIPLVILALIPLLVVIRFLASLHVQTELTLWLWYEGCRLP